MKKINIEVTKQNLENILTKYVSLLNDELLSEHVREAIEIELEVIQDNFTEWFDEVMKELS